MKPVLLTPSKAASLADAYRQFSENPELEGRVAGLTRLECYRLFQTVRFFYGQKGEALTISFIERIADGKVVLSGEIFNQEGHDPKLLEEHNQLVDKVPKDYSPLKTIFRSAPAAQLAEKEEQKEGVEDKPTRTDEIRALMEERDTARIEAHLKQLGISEERAKVYSSVVSTRLGEFSEEAARQKDIVQAIVKEVVPELTPEQVSGFSENFLNTSDTGERSSIGTALDSTKFAKPTGPSPRPAAASSIIPGSSRESSQEMFLRLGHKERGLFGQFKNDFLNQIIPGRREKQEAAAFNVAKGALQNLSVAHPEQESVVRGLQEALGHKEVLRKIDPSGQAFFFKPDEAPPLALNYGTFEFRVNPGGADLAGNISVRSLGRGMPSIPRPPVPSAAVSDEGGGGFASGAVNAGMQARDAYRLLGTETGKKVAQATMGRLGALGARIAASALPAIGGAISAFGSGALAVAGTVGSILAGVTSGAVATVGAPVLIAIIIGLLVIILVFGFMAITGNQRLYVAEGTPSQAVQSEYIDIVARISPSVYKEDLPHDFELTIVVTAKKKNLENVKLSEAFSVYAAKGNPYLPPLETHALPTEMEEGKSETISYKINLGSGFKDSIFTNTVTVSADVVDGPKDEKTITSTSTLIGEVPTGCFVFQGNWTDDKRALELEAIGTLARSTALMGNICRGGAPIALVRSYEPKNYGGFKKDNNTIIIYSLGVSDKMSTLYTLAHEAGHVVDGRNPDLLRLHFPYEIKGEGFLPTYPLEKSVWEDFAETVALYVVWREMPFRCCGIVNMPKDFSKHYKFAQERIFGEHTY